jgi:hypothetical protein
VVLQRPGALSLVAAAGIQNGVAGALVASGHQLRDRGRRGTHFLATAARAAIR